MLCSTLSSSTIRACDGQDKGEVQHQISILLFVGLCSGFFMLFFTKFFGSWALTGNEHCCLNIFFFFSLSIVIVTFENSSGAEEFLKIKEWGKSYSTNKISFLLFSAFTGPKNAHIVPASNTYVQVHSPTLLQRLCSY